MKALFKPIAWVIAAVMATGNFSPVQAATPGVLETYDLGIGDDSEGIGALLFDKRFGGGSAKALVRYQHRKIGSGVDQDHGRLRIKVSRYVKRKLSVTPLVCTSVEVRGFDSNDAQIFSTTLAGFRFERRGRYKKRVDDIPTEVSRLEIVFAGQYGEPTVLTLAPAN